MGTKLDRHAVLPAARRLQARAVDHSLSLVAAGVAFYAFLALVPTIAVTMTIYSVFADPVEIERHIEDNAAAVPEEVRALLTAEIRSIGDGGATARTVAVAIGFVLALWTASAGMNGLIRGIDIANGHQARQYVRRRGLSLGLTLGAIVLLVVLGGLVVVIPPLLGTTDTADGTRWLIHLLRWPLIAAVMTLALATLYRVVAGGSGRPRLIPGPVVGAVLWLVGSAGFSVYTANFARYGRTYGSLAGIAAMLLWLYLGAAAVLVGAEVDADGRSRAGATPSG